MAKTTYYVDTTVVTDLTTGEVGTIETKKRQKVTVDAEPFYMVFIEHIAPFYNLSNATTKNVLVWMCNRAVFNTGQISLSSKDRKDMMDELGIKKSALSNALKELLEKKLIAGEQGTYTINPQIFWKGDLLTRNSILAVKEIQISFDINIESANLQKHKSDTK